MPKRAKRFVGGQLARVVDRGKRVRTDRPRPSAAKRGYDRRWREASKGFLRDNPLCAHCERVGHTEAATLVDHIVPHRGDAALFWDQENWQPLCQVCHNNKTRTEGAFGRTDAGKRYVVCGQAGTGKTTYVERRRHPGDLVYDLDALGATLCGSPRYPRPAHVLAVLIDLRSWLVDRVRSAGYVQDVWVIVADRQEAQQTAVAMGAELIDVALESPLQVSAPTGACTDGGLHQWGSAP